MTNKLLIGLAALIFCTAALAADYEWLKDPDAVTIYHRPDPRNPGGYWINIPLDRECIEAAGLDKSRGVRVDKRLRVDDEFRADWERAAALAHSACEALRNEG